MWLEDLLEEFWIVREAVRCGSFALTNCKSHVIFGQRIVRYQAFV